jgi:hypothetical protein
MRVVPSRTFSGIRKSRPGVGRHTFLSATIAGHRGASLQSSNEANLRSPLHLSVVLPFFQLSSESFL